MPRTDAHRGQVLPVILATLALAAAAITLGHRVARGLGQESEVVNAADAAAYSGASWTARRLNLIAYTNRALIANHIAVGHLVAYISWLRYADEAAEQIARYTQFLPYVGPATRSAEQAVSAALRVSAGAAGVYIRGADAYLDLLAIAQLDARRGLRAGRVAQVMTQVAHEYDTAFAVNARDDLDGMPAPYDTIISARRLSQRISAYRALETVAPGRDKGYFQRVLEQTMNHDAGLRRWLQGPSRRGRLRYGRGGRDWEKEILKIIRFRKQGVTHNPPLPDAGGWRAGDRFQVSYFDPRKLSWDAWATLAEGRASANELGGGYRGVRRYTRLRRRPDDEALIRIPALVTAPLPGGDTDEGLNAHLSVGVVRYHVPEACGRRCPSRQRPATLFNPYWEAALARVEALGLP